MQGEKDKYVETHNNLAFLFIFTWAIDEYLSNVTRVRCWNHTINVSILKLR